MNKQLKYEGAGWNDTTEMTLCDTVQKKTEHYTFVRSCRTV